MKLSLLSVSIRALVLAMVLSWPALSLAAQPPGAKSAPTNSAAVVEIAKSVFIIPSGPKEGRNPFFPRSKAEMPVVKSKEAVVDTTSLVLNGLTGPPKRMAMINGRTLEVGETAELKLRDGRKLAVECLEIRDDMAILKVGNERKELRLRSGI